MATLSISPALLERLTERATVCGLTPDELLERWLTTTDPLDAIYLHSILASETAFILRTDLNGIITYSNAHFSALYEHSTDEQHGQYVIGTPALDTIHPEDHSKTLQTSEWCIYHPNTPRQVVLRKPKATGGFIWTLWEFTGLTNAEGTVCEIQCVGFEITEQIGAQQALSESEERYRIVSELTSDFAFAYRVNPDRTTALEWISGSFQRVTGYDRVELGSAVPYSVYEPEVIPQVRQHIERVLQGEVIIAEYPIKHKNGERRWLRIQRQPIWATDQSRVVRFYGVAQDITEQRHSKAVAAEHERLTAILERERRWNTNIGQMVRVLSHELRVPLAVINSSSDMIRRYERIYGAEQRAEKVAAIQAQVQRITQIIEEAVQVVRGFIDSPLHLREVNLLNLCRACIEDIQHSSIGHHAIQIAHPIDHELRIVTDETLFSRILLNLLSNAVKYSPPVVPILLHVAKTDGQLILSVEDHGIGIPAHEHDQVFQPLFRAANVRMGDISGTGLGLNIVKDSVEKLGGTISFTSVLGQGTTFTVTLPTSHAP